MRYIIILLTLLLTGCATTRPSVVLGCNVKLPPEPHYPVQDLKLGGDKPATVAKAYVATTGLQHDRIQLLENVIKRCG